MISRAYKKLLHRHHDQLEFLFLSPQLSIERLTISSSSLNQPVSGSERMIPSFSCEDSFQSADNDVEMYDKHENSDSCSSSSSSTSLALQEGVCAEAIVNGGCMLCEVCRVNRFVSCNGEHYDVLKIHLLLDHTSHVVCQNDSTLDEPNKEKLDK
jgi:hypothetical protein